MRSLIGNTNLIGFFLLTFLVSNSEALVLRNYTAAAHDRFTGFSSNPAHNLSFIHAAYDLTGVGWHTGNTARQLTMVSPIHFVGANHYKPGLGATLRFVASDGSTKNYTVASQVAITNDAGADSDLFYGTLTNPIAESDLVSFHPFLNLTHVVRRGRNLVVELDENAYLNKSLIILGKTARGGIGELLSTIDISSDTTNLTRVLQWQYTTASGSNNDAYLQGGDSGSPVFINQGGIAAIIGTHSLVSNAAEPIKNYSNFIPYYVDKLDTAMASHGYHMTRAIPGSTTLVLSHTPPSNIIRAGHSFTLNYTLNNTGSNLADNVKFQNPFPSGTIVSNAIGTDWFDESSASTAKARRAYLDSSASSICNVTLNIPTPGTTSYQVSYSCDQFAANTENFNLNVIESYISWSSALSNQTSSGDDDLDGVSNLLEYAFGGDPAISSQTLPGTTISLLPVYDGNSITYLRRTDYANRALTYELTSSTTMTAGTWLDASGMVNNTTVTTIAGTDFEQVKLDLTSSGTERFFRIKVTLSE